MQQEPNIPLHTKPHPSTSQQQVDLMEKTPVIEKSKNSSNNNKNNTRKTKQKRARSRMNHNIELKTQKKGHPRSQNQVLL